MDGAAVSLPPPALQKRPSRREESGPCISLYWADFAAADGEAREMAS
jgi:hypothetical protein